MPMNCSSLDCTWSDRKSRLSLTRACEFFSFSQEWTFQEPFGPTMCSFGLSLDPCSSIVEYWTICTHLGLVFDRCWTLAHFCEILWTIREFLVGSLLDLIGFLSHFVIGLSIGIVCVIAVL